MAVDSFESRSLLMFNKTRLFSKNLHDVCGRPNTHVWLPSGTLFVSFRHSNRKVPRASSKSQSTLMLLLFLVISFMQVETEPARGRLSSKSGYERKWRRLLRNEFPDVKWSRFVGPVAEPRMVEGVAQICFNWPATGRLVMLVAHTARDCLMCVVIMMPVVVGVLVVVEVIVAIVVVVITLRCLR